MACYAIVVLGMNVALVMSVVLVTTYARGLYGIGHLLIGEGQHAMLRVALGTIETLSGSFRSVSLSLRIVCNSVAGHVLLAVLVEMTHAVTSDLILCTEPACAGPATRSTWARTSEW